jgi:hydrogenase expression/formation protein HypD
MRYGIDELLPQLNWYTDHARCASPEEEEKEAMPGATLVSYGDTYTGSPDLPRRGRRRRAHRVLYGRGRHCAAVNDRQVVFRVGLETTAPANSMAARQREGLCNFSILVSHVLVLPAVRLPLGFPTIAYRVLRSGARLRRHGIHGG